MNVKVGDRILLRTLEEIKALPGAIVTDAGTIRFPGYNLVNAMMRNLGKEVIVEKVRSDHPGMFWIGNWCYRLDYLTYENTKELSLTQSVS